MENEESGAKIAVSAFVQRSAIVFHNRNLNAYCKAVYQEPSETVHSTPTQTHEKNRGRKKTVDESLSV